MEKLKHGVVEYVPSPVTIWDKEFVLIDEINRSVAELQSKWLEVIRSRKIMGFPTQVKWVWSAMNPLNYAGAQVLDAALVGRFAVFVYPPDVLQMDEEDRIKVARHLNGEDAPGLSQWTGNGSPETVDRDAILALGAKLHDMLQTAGSHFLRLQQQMTTLPEFLAKFADLLVRETQGEVALDGRRLGFIHRNLLANRAVELAKAEVLSTLLPDFVESARYVVQSSIPVDLNDEGLNREEAVHKMEICFDLLSSYFEEDAELTRVNLIYELFTTPDLMRKAELLLTHNLGELALSKAWTDLMQEEAASLMDLTLLAYTALQVEARRPNTVPQELLASLCGNVRAEKLSTGCVPHLEGDAVEYVEEVEHLLDQESDLARLVAYQQVAQLIDSDQVNPETLARTERAIEEDIRHFEALLEGTGPDKDEGVPMKEGVAA